jgi:hypothetical protein
LHLASAREDIRFVPERQHALTVIAPIGRAREDEVVAALEARKAQLLRAFSAVPTLHFARFVVLRGRDGRAPLLAFESNHDGERAAHVAELARALAPLEEVTFGAWEGYCAGRLADFVEQHHKPAATFYLGHPGLSVRQIKRDAAVREALDARLDRIVEEGRIAGRSAAAIRDELLLGLAETGLVLGPRDRGLPTQPFAKLEMVGVGTLAALTAVVLLPLALVVEAREARTEPPRELVTEDDPRLDRILAHEDAVFQNGLTHHVPIRPGRFRRTTLRLVLWVIEKARRTIAYQGQLGGITSIHFARWIVLDDGTLLFFSNYDGSWEAYLGDFVDKAHHYLSAVWANTRWFPETRALIWQGAAHEATFKQWARTFQVDNPIWYSAYPDLTVTNILGNAKIREGAAGAMTEAEARAWLARL